MATGRKITYKIDVDETGAVIGARKVERALDKVGDEAKQTDRQVDRVGKGMQTMGALAATGGAALAAGLGLALVKGVQLAENVEETASKYETTLGPAIDEANGFIRRYATLMGLSVTEAKELLATNTNIAKSFGLETDAAADLSMQLLKTAGDLASFNNVPIEQSTRAITSALVGEREALKTLGIVITEQMVKQQAMTQFNLKSKDAVTQEMEALATMTLVREKAGVAMGDLMRTQDSAANQRRRVMAQIKNLGEVLSMGLMPAYNDTIGLVGELVDELEDWLGLKVSESIKAERNQLNVLVRELANANTGEERRKELINTINREYPDFLKNIDAEKASSEELLEVLEDVNKEYRERIARQIASENISEAVSEQVEAQRELVQARRETRKLLQEAAVSGAIDRSGFESMTVVEQMHSALDQMSNQDFSLFGEDFTNDFLEQLNDLTWAKSTAEKATESLNQVRKEEQAILKEMGLSLGDNTGKNKDNTEATRENTAAQKNYSAELDYMTRLINGDLFPALDNLDDKQLTLTEQLKAKKDQLNALITSEQNLTGQTWDQAKALQGEIVELEDLIRLREKYIELAAGQTLSTVEVTSVSTLGDMGGDKITDQEIAGNVEEQSKKAEMDAWAAGLQTVESGYKSVAEALGLVGQQGAAAGKSINNSMHSASGSTQALVAVSTRLGDALLQAALRGGDLKNILADIAIQLASKALMTGLKLLLTGGIGSVGFFGAMFGFERGGRLPEAQRGMVANGPSHAAGGMLAMINGRPTVEFEGGEAIINKRSTEMFLPELSAINQAGGGVPLARDGALTLNSISRSKEPVPSVNNGIDTGAIAQAAKEGIESATVVAVMKDSLEDLHERLDNLEKFNNRYNP